VTAVVAAAGVVLAAITTDTWWMIALAWVLSLGAIALYAASVVRRGRRLSEQVPESSRRWL
jgi:hypothetical protein